MRVRVRSIEPPVDAAGLEEIEVRLEPDPAGRPRAETSPGEPARRRLMAADLGPNGDVVLDLLSRASRLTPAECRSLEKAAGWRWWMVTPLAGTTMPAARARALVLGRADDRSAAIVALEAAVAVIGHRLCGPKAGRSRLPACISNAGLAVLVRDLVEPETFEMLFGPWREVMHH
jgi:hypothetical protein